MGSVSVSSCRCCMFMPCVHPVVVLNATFSMTCSLMSHLSYILDIILQVFIAVLGMYCESLFLVWCFSNIL